MDFTYLTRSIHTGFKGSIGKGGKESCAADDFHCQCLVMVLRVVNERVASVIFSCMYEFNATLNLA